jgi:hypothetical protein
MKKEFTDEELDQMTKDHTKELLSQAVQATRRQHEGISLEEVSEIILSNLDQAEAKVLIEQLVDIYGKRYGRLYE